MIPSPFTGEGQGGGELWRFSNEDVAKIFFCAAYLCFILLLSFNDAPAEDGIPDPFPGLALSYLLMSDGRIMWAHQHSLRLPPASLTKVMSALLVIRQSKLNSIATVSRDAAAETGTRLGLRVGEKMSVEDLLAATLLKSANDACHVLADHVAGSETRFVILMNQEAVMLGMRNTHFTNACGHDDPAHYSTASDMARLTEAALKEPVFKELVAVVLKDIHTIDGRRTFSLVNKNELVGRYPGAVGVKTGFTDKAGKCLIALVEGSSARVLLIMLNAPDRWWSAVSMLDRAFEQIEQQNNIALP